MTFEANKNLLRIFKFEPFPEIELDEAVVSRSETYIKETSDLNEIK